VTALNLLSSMLQIMIEIMLVTICVY